MSVLLQEKTEGVLTMTLNRPERLNALNTELHTELIAALQAAEQAEDVRVIVITGAGRGFCAGLDLTDGTSLDWNRQPRHERYDQYGWVGRLALAIAQNDKPVLAAIGGMAAGAGLALALACDLRLMAESARITAGYIRRGLSPDAGLTWFLPRLIGHGRAAEFVMTGRDMGAAEAERIGLVSEVCADAQLATRAQQLAAVLAAGPPIALTMSKRMLLASQELSLEETLKREFAAIKLCFQTRDVQEGVQAFAEKRLPQFRGE